MKKSRFTEEQVVAILAEADRGEQTIGDVAPGAWGVRADAATTGGSDFGGWAVEVGRSARGPGQGRAGRPGGGTRGAGVHSVPTTGRSSPPATSRVGSKGYRRITAPGRPWRERVRGERERGAAARVSEPGVVPWSPRWRG